MMESVLHPTFLSDSSARDETDKLDIFVSICKHVFKLADRNRLFNIRNSKLHIKKCY